MKTIEQMIEVLKHYTNADIYEWSVKQIVEAYCKLYEE